MTPFHTISIQSVIEEYSEVPRPSSRGAEHICETPMLYYLCGQYAYTLKALHTHTGVFTSRALLRLKVVIMWGHWTYILIR